MIIAISVVTGLVLGIKAGHDFCGVRGAVVGGIIGPFFGYFLGRVPEIVSTALQKHQIRKMSVDALIALLKPQRWQPVDLVLSELKERGIDITEKEDLLFSLMASEHIHERLMGKRTFEMCFPERIHVLANYSPFDNASICREKLSVISKLNK